MPTQPGCFPLILVEVLIISVLRGSARLTVFDTMGANAPVGNVE